MKSERAINRETCNGDSSIVSASCPDGNVCFATNAPFRSFNNARAEGYRSSGSLRRHLEIIASTQTGTVGLRRVTASATSLRILAMVALVDVPTNGFTAVAIS